MSDPRIMEMLTTYVDLYMADLGPYVSSVFFKLLLDSAQERKRRDGYIKITHLSVNEIAKGAGMSKRKAINALKALKECWITIQLNRKGRGNKNYYYFLPVEKWVSPGSEKNDMGKHMGSVK